VTTTCLAPPTPTSVSWSGRDLGGSQNSSRPARERRSGLDDETFHDLPFAE
jgi:hypothetical protein